MMGATEIKGILFDKDGTLFDFQATWGAWGYGFFLELAGGDAGFAAKLADHVGYDFRSKQFRPDSIVVAHTAMEVAQALGELVPKWGVDALFDFINNTVAVAPQVEPVPLKPLLSAFRASGLKLGVATNDAEAPARAHLAKAGITDQFDFIAGSDSGFGGKPDIGMLKGFCQAVGLQACQVMMVGDSRHDLIAGRKAEMTSVAVLTGLATRAHLAPYADVILSDIGEIPGYLWRDGP